MSSSREYIPFGRPNFTEAEINSVAGVMRKGWIGMGPETIAFEQELALAVDAPHVVTVNTCTSALFLSLLTAGIGEGDEVICPSLTWCSSANVALYLGAKVVFCDIDEDTLSLTTETVISKLSPKTKAVIVVHYGGYAVAVDALKKALPPHICVIEDAAHALGSAFPNHKKVGSSGNPTCFSFYANKNLSTGEGGAIALFDQEQAERIRSLRQHALPLDAWKRFTHPQTVLLSNHLTELGYKMNYTDLQACIGRVQLARFDELQQNRLKIAQIYVEAIASRIPEIRFQTDILSASHARHLFVIQLPDNIKMTRDEVVLAMRAHQIGATIHYTPLHYMPLYIQEEKAISLPVVEHVSKRIMTLPISSSMAEADALHVANTLIDILP